MIINILVGAVLGILSGFGIGGGSIFILYLTMILQVEQLTAQGINLAYFICSGTPALYSHLKAGRVDKKAMIWCSLSGIFSSILAGYFANMIDTDFLRRIFGLLIAFIGIKLLFSKESKSEKQ